MLNLYTINYHLVDKSQSVGKWIGVSGLTHLVFCLSLPNRCWWVWEEHYCKADEVSSGTAHLMHNPALEHNIRAGQYFYNTQQIIATDTHGLLMNIL